MPSSANLTAYIPGLDHLNQMTKIVRIPMVKKDKLFTQEAQRQVDNKF